MQARADAGRTTVPASTDGQPGEPPAFRVDLWTLLAPLKRLRRGAFRSDDLEFSRFGGVRRVDFILQPILPKSDRLLG
jgi:hypothetical protein